MKKKSDESMLTAGTKLCYLAFFFSLWLVPKQAMLGSVHWTTIVFLGSIAGVILFTGLSIAHYVSRRRAVAKQQ